MSATVIDSLIIKLGLDPRDFTRGEKEVAASALRLKRDVSKSAEGMSDSIEDAAKSFASSGGTIARIASKAGPIGIAIAAMGVGAKLASDQIFKVAENVRALGLTAKNFDISAAGLRNFQNAAELAGGSMEDATASVGGLKKALFDLKFNGNVSDQIVALSRLGVDYTQDYTSVATSTASKLKQAQANGTMSQGEAIFFAQQAGFQGGLAQLVATGGPEGVAAALSKQRARRQVGASDFNTATDVVTSSQSRDQAAFAELGVRGLAQFGSTQAAGSRGVESVITGGAHGAAAATEYLGQKFDQLGSKVADAAIAVRDFITNIRQQGGVGGAVRHSEFLYRPTIEAAAKKYGVNPEVLTGIIRTESGFNPDAVNKKSGARGIAQLNPKYFKDAGKNPFNDIYTAAQHLRGLQDSFLSSGNDRDAAEYLAVEAYNAGETRLRTSSALTPGGKPLAAETVAYPGKVYAGLPTPGAQASGSGSNSTQVQIDSITVNTQATDANGIAGDLNESLSRKLLASHAEPGMQ